MRVAQSLISIGTAAAMMMPSMSLAADTDMDANMDDMQTTSTTSTSEDTDFLQSFFGKNMTGGTSTQTTIDIQALTAHPCYDAVGLEQDYCLEMFGVTTDFEGTLGSSALNRTIIENAVRAHCDTVVDGEARADCRIDGNALLEDLGASMNNNGSDSNDEDMDEDNNDEPMTEQQRRSRDEMEMRRESEARAKHLWKICEGSDETQAGCYQTHLRFVTDLSVSEEEIESVLRVDWQAE